ncbi:MAG TPA: isocitrate lyase/phosphoenolpyruvate mutase family protein [Candidatus Limnocylindria bacterium]|nr:isocitrate lyase/phosphoenolpyruvate mutase family protein [Candidatus Limnocylindria bacterium]
MRALAGDAERLLSLHHAAQPLILPNAWDVASARAVERAGAAAIATTSSGVAEALGYADGEAIPPAEMFSAVARIAAAVTLPVTADLEAGYGLPAEELVRRLLGAGAVGLNLEDTDRSGDAPRLMDLAQAAERIRGVRKAADAAGVHVVINARVDSFLRGPGDADAQLEDAVLRSQAYLDAGADCIYPIWLTDVDAIARLVREVDAPINILLRPGAPDAGKLAALGVRRISVGGGLARHALTVTEQLARRVVAGDGRALLELGEG